MNEQEGLDHSSDLRELELSIRSNDPLHKQARAILLHWLREHVEDGNHNKSIGELIVLACKECEAREVLPVLLRCLVVPDLLPGGAASNEMQWAMISMAESAVTELVAYLRIDPKTQNYIKYKALEGTHSKLCETLQPIRAPFADIDGAMAARKVILGILNHSVVRFYCSIFDSAKVKAVVEEVYYKLKQVSAVGQTLLLDVEDCKRAVTDGLRLADENGSFLALDFLRPFLNHVSVSLDKFLSTIRSRFTTSVAPGFSGELQKRYPLHESGRNIQISVPFRNSGPGLATSVKISSSASSDSMLIENETIYLGNVQPGEFAVVLDIFIVDPADKFIVMMLLEWGEIGEATLHSGAYEFSVVAQAKNIDWSTKEYWRPYSTEPAEGESFIGRQEKVRTLAAKLIREPMESFFLTGQKRVGKTSLALACIEFAKAHQSEREIVSSYNLWGSFAHVNPAASLESLGRQIETLIKDSVPGFLNQPSADFSGSLAPLIRLANLAYQVSPMKRFVIVIDEFDEIHQELYLFGNLAETFFANLRAISRCKNVCFVLVGGENMPYVMERQGQKLNNFSRASLSYYGRDSEWSDFRSMIQSPVSGVINWYDDSLAEVFNVSNGNPYFAKIICAAALEIAVQERDTDISVREIRHATESRTSLLGANSFAHLWQDGIPRPQEEREPDVLLRQRVLVALARCYMAGEPPTLSNILTWRVATNISESEVSAVLRDFVRRDVLADSQGLYIFRLPIFEQWLTDVGAAQLAADSLTAELANSALVEEMALAVRADEIAALVERWPTYRGRHIGSEEVRAWLQQVDGSKSQRLLFELLERIDFLSEARVREMFEQSFGFLQPLPDFVIRRRSDRRRNVIVTYIDGEGKSGFSYASIFAEANLISGDCIFPRGEFAARIERHLAAGDRVDSVVIVDDMVGTGKSLLGNIETFIRSNSDSIPLNVPVKLISLVATLDGQKRILDGIGKLDRSNIDFRACRVLGDENFAFPENIVGWSSTDDRDRARALCFDLGKKIYSSNPLGFGGKGLLLVFPTNTPNNSLPILHTPSRVGGGKAWKPLFPRMTH
jgi:AAA domain